MKRKSGFTLVEMLVVVVIIGILSAALIPRLTGYMARTRDLQRKMDLQNIATAIEAYKNDTGKLPTRGWEGWTEYSRGTLQASPCFPYETFAKRLKPYLTSVPKDPVKTNFVVLHEKAKNALEKGSKYYYSRKYEVFSDGRELSCEGHEVPQGSKGVSGLPGQYFYQIFQKGGIQMGAAIIAAKVETPQMANYIRFKEYGDLQGGFLKHNYSEQVGGVWIQKIVHDINDLKLCTSVEKGKQARWDLQADGSYKCYYTDQDQLYYIVKIE